MRIQHLAILILLSVLTPAVQADDKGRFGLAKLNPFSSSKPEATTETKVARQFAVGPLSAEAKNEALAKEREAYFRRTQVCLQLRKIAMETGDEALLQHADKLDTLALQTYKTRISRFGVKTPADIAPLEDLDRKLGTGIAATPLTSGIRVPSEAQPARPATAQIRNFREVAP
jgi:hypothetical protein